MTLTATERHVIMTEECPHCHAEQDVQVRATTGFLQMEYQTICCAGCNRPFDVRLPDHIIGGPFLKETMFPSLTCPQCGGTLVEVSETERVCFNDETHRQKTVKKPANK